MSLGLSLIHLLNFLAPALFLGLVLPLLEAGLCKAKLSSRTWLTSSALYFSTTSLILLIGLFVLGRDGKMLTYAGLIVTNALILTWRTRRI
ncbi:MAG: hypothetical protein RLZZ612_1518 [Pseudomonadota bacterium]|jgi:hypothetical protein